jgi:hypothetical protein
MKSILFLLFALISTTTLTAKKAHPGPCPKSALHIVMRYTPVIVYGKFIALDSSGYTLQVEEVLKGQDISKKIKNITIHLDRKRPGKPKTFFDKNSQAYSIYYLSKNMEKGWTIDYGYCMPRQLACEGGKIELGAQFVSFANFRTGLALFMQNYEQLIKQKAKGKKMVAPKNMKNATYRFLVNDMNSPDESKY